MLAALELFSRRDIASVTIKDIARALEVNTALIYYYFDSKDDLFRACLRYCIDRTKENFRRFEGRHDDPAELISAWFATHAEMYVQIRQLVKVMLDYVASGSRTRGTDLVVEEFYAHETRLLTHNIRLGVKQGVFAPVDVRQAALFASTHLDGIMVRSLIQKEIDVPAAIRKLEKVFFRYLKKRG